MRGPLAWAYSGTVVPGYPAFHPLTEDFRPKFWKVFSMSRSPEAGARKLSWRSSRRMIEVGAEATRRGDGNPKMPRIS